MIKEQNELNPESTTVPQDKNVTSTSSNEALSVVLSEGTCLLRSLTDHDSVQHHTLSLELRHVQGMECSILLRPKDLHQSNF